MKESGDSTIAMADTEQDPPKEDAEAPKTTEAEKAKPADTASEEKSETKTQENATQSRGSSPSPAEATAATVPPNSPPAGAGKNSSSNDSNEAVMKLVKSGKLSPQESQAVKALAKDHAALKIKVDRLKGLLGRSAKAQREAKGVFPVKSFVCYPFRSGRHKF